MQMPTGREPILKLKHDSLPASLSPVGPLEKTRAPEETQDCTGQCSVGALGSWPQRPSGPHALTLGVGFLEGVAGVHKAGGRVMLALELQVQLGCLAEGVSGSWKRRVILA